MAPRWPEQLSGGQEQRVAVLRQVICQTSQSVKVILTEICGSFAWLSPATLCTVVQIWQRAPHRLSFITTSCSSVT